MTHCTTRSTSSGQMNEFDNQHARNEVRRLDLELWQQIESFEGPLHPMLGESPRIFRASWFKGFDQFISRLLGRQVDSNLRAGPMVRRSIEQKKAEQKKSDTSKAA